MSTTKLVKIGSSTGVVLPQDVLSAAGMEQGDAVTVSLKGETVEIVRVSQDDTRALEIGRRFAQRYHRTMSDLAK
ncbi:AbrB/MazE/SpoVT family DNA-binding domain-containing protein [Aquibaculum arenosum]|uniref:SpoVT-AbrB domain-containing protein n=1 Tax=Aquibaculum arenosum TaxID=3032591 RepID=A0ABT5YM79_9PROT|nr:AbrB/MazE/SpoVT family DNA-binding domain-containing protein [Fodinicurvata sp. CAU 1616]MDF2096066.1 hypothetical protein [Fodinicurvata sp. CAU 1616]